MAKKILVVDDEEDVRIIVKKLLEEEGYKISTAKDGAECLNLLRKQKFDLVLIDFLMPSMSGRELARRIRKDSSIKNTKFAFLTIVQFGKEGIRELKKLGSLDYIKKPFDNNELKARIKKIA